MTETSDSLEHGGVCPFTQLFEFIDAFLVELRHSEQVEMPTVSEGMVGVVLVTVVGVAYIGVTAASMRVAGLVGLHQPATFARRRRVRLCLGRHVLDAASASTSWACCGPCLRLADLTDDALLGCRRCPLPWLCRTPSSTQLSSACNLSILNRALTWEMSFCQLVIFSGDTTGARQLNEGCPITCHPTVDTRLGLKLSPER